MVNSSAPLILRQNYGSNQENTSDVGGGLLRAVILSANDLSSSDIPPPSYVEVSVGETTMLRTGPPAQRHKDRNSFKFAGTTRGDAIAAPLADLYSSVATVRVVYANNPAYNLTATYALHQLKIHETMWLILQLDREEEPGNDDDRWRQ